MNLYANYHTHTARCGHADGTEREYIEHAIRGGIRVLGFADHAPYPYPRGYRSGMRMQPSETESYVNTLLSLKKEYAHDIEIRIGYEIEYFPTLFRAALEQICAYPVDYLIMGQHFVGTEYDGFYAGSYTDDPARLRAYVDAVTQGIATGAFSYIAHPDLPAWSGDGTVYRTEMRRLCTAAKNANLPLEINFLGLSEHRQYPCDSFWEIAHDVGCDAVFGCDAHTPAVLSDRALVASACDYADRFGMTVLPKIPLYHPSVALKKL